MSAQPCCDKWPWCHCNLDEWLGELDADEPEKPEEPEEWDKDEDVVVETYTDAIRHYDPEPRK